ncbi:MAG TPA: HAD family hydrolase [Phycisphaerae bacterium]|nr:HAD family hydrolase [Phycisphaerae bacterium]
MALKLVIFDLDGTLLEPALDFDAIRAEIGLPPGATILEAMDTLSKAERVRANAILDRHEARAARRSRLMPGAKELLDWLGAQGIRTAVLTRNSRRSVENACQKHGLEFSGVIAREDHLPKPSPVGVRHLMTVLGAGPDETVVVGDFRFDVEAGAAAGCRTIALVSDPAPAWASEATWTAADLAEVRRILEAAVAERGSD